MAEAPEIKISAECMREKYLGLTITNAGFPQIGKNKDPNKVPNLKEFYHLMTTSQEPFTLDSVETYGKMLWWTLKNKNNKKVYFLFDYKSKAYWKDCSPINEKDTIFYAKFRNVKGEESFFSFIDMWKWGNVRIEFDLSTFRLLLRKTCPDIFTDEFNKENILKLYSNFKIKKTKLICELLLDSELFAGVGSYMRSESLWLAKINPHKPSENLSQKEWESLIQSLKSIANESYNCGGAKIRNYLPPNNIKSLYEYKVHNKEKDINGRNVKIDKDSNDFKIYWVPERQK